MKPTHTYQLDAALMRRPSKCRRCGARIVFADHPVTGSRVPLDVATRQATPAAGVFALQVHFAVCGQRATASAPPASSPRARRHATVAALERDETYGRGEE